MKKVRSVKKTALRYFGIIMAMSVLCILLTSVYSAWVYQKQMRYCNEATQAVALNTLSYTLEDLSEFGQDTSSNDTDFILLSYGNGQITVKQRMESLYHLRRIINSRVPTAGAIFLCDSTGSIFYYRFGSQFRSTYMTLPDLEFMRAIHGKLLEKPDTWLNQWQVVTEGTCTVLMNAYRLRELYICSMLDLNAFSEAYTAGADNVRHAFYTEDRVLTGQAYLEEHGILLDELLDPSGSVMDFYLRGRLVEAGYLPRYGVGLASIIPITGIWTYSRTYLLIAAGMLLCILLTAMAAYAIVKRTVIYPLDEIAAASRRLTGIGEEEPRQSTDLKELADIRMALDQLVGQKVELTRENESRVQERNHAVLQYYQLQTRSHFLLNCLKSIYSMTEKGETEKTKRMIMLFSNHMRYIFHDTLSLIPLRAELEEVSDYYQIIQLDRRTPVLLEVDVPPELLAVQVPPLTIQTFIENSYKYNNAENKLLRFHIQADCVRFDGADYLRLRLSDNGRGYSQEVLEALEQPGEMFGSQHVGINNLRRRISILFDGDYQMGFFNATDGGAITVIYLPMTKGEAGQP